MVFLLILEYIWCIDANIMKKNSVSLIEIIYIGQADNICDRHKNHEKNDLFKSQLLVGEELCFS